MRVEVVRPGKDANNTFSRGSRVRVTCGHGYELNIGKRLARCVRGHWKPDKPNCVASEWIDGGHSGIIPHGSGVRMASADARY